MQVRRSTACVLTLLFLSALLAPIRGGPPPAPYTGAGTPLDEYGQPVAGPAMTLSK